MGQQNKLRVARTYHDLEEAAGKRIIVNQGGTRSGKTYSILQWLVDNADLNEGRGITYSICRKTSTALRDTALRDFVEILDSFDAYDPTKHNKTERTYQYAGNTFEFFGVDEPQKVRGRKREVLFINEANELTFEDWTQLKLRTSNKIILDYNPSDEFHWIYDRVIPRDDTAFYQTTYKDNPFLEPDLVREIEALQGKDPVYWKIYGLGERAASEASIYTNWDLIDWSEVPEVEAVYGLDFGFNNPTALVEIRIKEDDLFVKQRLYRRKLTNTLLIKKLKDMKLHKPTVIYADTAEPQRIEEIYQAGFNVHPSDKSVVDGIDHVKRYNIYIDKESSDLIKEIKSYKWKEDKDGNVLDDPVKFNDHLMDAIRYPVHTHFKTRTTTIGGAKINF